MRESGFPERIKQVAVLALQAADQLLSEWLPEGSRKGREWVACNTARGDRQAGSFGVSLDTGRWNDFADSSARGGDLVSLLAYLRGCRQFEAAQEIDQRLGLGLFEQDSNSDRYRQCAEQAKNARQAVEAKQQQAQLELHKQYRDTARWAIELWGMAKPADRHHPYLQAKNLGPYGLRQLNQGRLLIPVCWQGKLVNLQIVNAKGQKRFLRGGRVTGCYSPLGRYQEGQRLYICEGWATGATLHAHTGSPVACALSANNLKSVALDFRQRYGAQAELVIAGDDDRETSNNPGRFAALQAASEAQALVVFPEWPALAPRSLSDFNDLYQWYVQQGLMTGQSNPLFASALDKGVDRD